MMPIPDVCSGNKLQAASSYHVDGGAKLKVTAGDSRIFENSVSGQCSCFVPVVASSKNMSRVCKQGALQKARLQKIRIYLHVCVLTRSSSTGAFKQFCKCLMETHLSFEIP